MPLKTLQYELSNWQGMDRYTPETEADPHFWFDLQNMDCDEAGVTSKRRGAQGVLATFSGTIRMIYDHQSQQGFGTLSTTDNQRTLIVSGSVLSVVKDFATTNQTVSKTFAATSAVHYAVSDDVGVAYITNELSGIPKMLCYVKNNWVYQDATLAAPSGTFTITAGAAVSFSISGSFSGECSYVDHWGNESPLSGESNEIAITDTSINMPVIVSSDPTVDYLKFYVLGPGMSEYQFSGTFANTAGTYSHSMGMAELMAGDFPPENLVSYPKGKYITIYEDMILLAGDPEIPDAVFCGNRQFHRMWSALTDTADIPHFARAVTGDGRPIRGFADSFDRKLVVKADSLHLCQGDHQDTFNLRIYNHNYGAVGQTAITYADSRACWFSDDGVYVDNGQSAQEASRPILNYLRTLDYRNIIAVPPKLVADTYKYYRQAFFAVREFQEATGENNRLLVWNYLRNTWTKYAGNVPCALGAIQNQDNYEYLFGGNNQGGVWLFSPPNTFNVNDDNFTGTSSQTISCYAETPWMNMAKLQKMPDWERTRTIPRYLQVYASGSPANGEDTVNLDCSYFVDFNRDNAVSSFSLSFPAHQWPTVRPYKQTIYYGGAVGTYQWVKWRFEHAYLGQHIKIHKLVFAGRLKPAID